MKAQPRADALRGDRRKSRAQPYPSVRSPAQTAPTACLEIKDEVLKTLSVYKKLKGSSRITQQMIDNEVQRQFPGAPNIDRIKTNLRQIIRKPQIRDLYLRVQSAVCDDLTASEFDVATTVNPSDETWLMKLQRLIKAPLPGLANEFVFNTESLLQAEPNRLLIFRIV